jgi:OmpA-OmpF porin, OOP family
MKRLFMLSVAIGFAGLLTCRAQESTSLKVYQNYDFVPGDTILFEDSFVGDQDGEFPTHWTLKGGQAVLNKVGGEEALHLTNGNYAIVAPRMKTEKYLTGPFTVEYDLYYNAGSFGLITFFKSFDKNQGFDRDATVHVGFNEVLYTPWEGSVISKSYPDLSVNEWHHAAMVYKNHQLKVYVDQARVLVIPETNGDLESISFGGIGDETNPIVFKNVRIALGGNMNLLGKKFTGPKIVTHGINFDIDKASIKPESMGTLNMILQMMKDNPDLKFEVGGHTDNSGSAAHNQTLSQQRADAVKDQLVKMGVDATKLSTKGYGDAKPISDNNTYDGQANNRRVEFVKM